MVCPFTEANIAGHEHTDHMAQFRWQLSKLSTVCMPFPPPINSKKSQSQSQRCTLYSLAKNGFPVLFQLIIIFSEVLQDHSYISLRDTGLFLLLFGRPGGRGAIILFGISAGTAACPCSACEKLILLSSNCRLSLQQGLSVRRERVV